MKIVIIGASFAGLSAALECRSLYPEATIVLIDKEEKVGYFPNALNWLLKGQITEWSEARSQLYKEVVESDIVLLLGSLCQAIRGEEKFIEILTNGQVQTVDYDYLILAMGAKQVWDNQTTESTERILRTKSIAQALESLEKIQEATSITVIGAGQIGLESLDAYHHLGIPLRVIEAQDWPLAKYFDQEMTQAILSELLTNGIDVHFSEAVNRILLAESEQITVETIKGNYTSDYLVVGTNFRPNTEGLEKVLELHSDGSVLVDAYLETSQKDIFAIGDLIHLPVAFFGQAYLPMINHALLTGRLVARNLVKKTKELKEVERIISSRIFGYNLTSVGLTEHEASLWLDTASVRLRQNYSQWEPELIDFKLVVSKTDGLLLGGQLISKSDHIAQMNVLAMAISQHLTVDDLLDQSWLCLPGQTALVPFLIEAARLYQQEGERG